MEAGPKHIFMGAIVMMVVVLGCMELVSRMTAIEPTFINSTDYEAFNNTFSKYQSIEDNTDTLRSTIENSDADLSESGTISGLIKAVWGTLKNMFRTFGFIGEILDGVSRSLHIPTWVTGSITMIIIVIVAFWVLSIIFKGSD